MKTDLESIAYHEGEYKKLADCNVNIATHSLQYGTMVFGGMRGYQNAAKDNINIFRLEDHYKRLSNSAKIMQMKMSVSPEEFKKITLDIVQKNNYKTNVYFRPFVYKNPLQLSPRLHDVSDDFAMYSLLLDDYLDTNRGLKTAVSSWRRIDDNIIPTRAKVGGGYANSGLAKSEAIQNGFDEAIFLDLRGFVSEGSAENLFMVRDGVLITPSLGSSILEGITRKTIIQFAEDEGIKVVERDVARAELYISDELFFSGTGAQIAWISEVDRRIISDGQMGPISQKMQELYTKTVQGELDRYKNWLTPVY